MKEAFFNSKPAKASPRALPSSRSRSTASGYSSAAISAILCLTTAPAYAQSASTFQNTCTHIFIAGSTLSADCRRMDGAFSPSSIDIPGIANIDGMLQFIGPGQPSSFQNSCGQIRVDGDVLSAVCRIRGGGYNQTSIEIPDIVNIDGVLQYAESGAPPEAGPDNFVWNGDTYDWYDDGWNGPGFYIVGYQFRRGRGYGGGEGWHGWRRHGGGPHHGAFHAAPGGAPPAPFAHATPMIHTAPIVHTPQHFHAGGPPGGGNFHPHAGPGGGPHPGGHPGGGAKAPPKKHP
jgi:hypothetical protein